MFENKPGNGKTPLFGKIWFVALSRYKIFPSHIFLIRVSNITNLLVYALFFTLNYLVNSHISNTSRSKTSYN